jgi:putative transposase
MTDDRMALVELLQKSGEGDFLRAVAEAVLQILMEADVEGLIGAGRHERTGERLNYRNGYRERSLDTRLGSLQLRIPKLRQGSYFPPFLEPRKTAEKALVTVIQEARIGGVSTRRVDELVQAMGLSGISKSHVSKLCKDIDERVNAFLDRPIDGEWPYLWLEATYLKVRDGGRIVSVAAIIAVAVSTDGRREIVGLGIGPSEAEPFWSAFLKGLVKRGLGGVKLVISDAHEGLRNAITRVLGATWQRCRVGLLKKRLLRAAMHLRLRSPQLSDDAKRACAERRRYPGDAATQEPPLPRSRRAKPKTARRVAANRLRLIAAAVNSA